MEKTPREAMQDYMEYVHKRDREFREKLEELLNDTPQVNPNQLTIFDFFGETR